MNCHGAPKYLSLSTLKLWSFINTITDMIIIIFLVKNYIGLFVTGRMLLKHEKSSKIE